MSGSNRDQLPGLQAERTLLAWDRTALGLLANGALLLLRDAEPGRFGPLVAAAGALALTFVTAVIGELRARRITALRSGTTPAPTAAVGTLASGVIVLALLVLVSTITGH